MSGYALRLDAAEVDRYQRMAAAARAEEGDAWQRAGIVPGARVVDLGCGPGATLIAMAETVGPDGLVQGIDGDPEAVVTATRLIAEMDLGNATAAVGDVGESGLDPGSSDVVVLRHVLAHNGPIEQRIVDHAASLVVPGGCVYLVDIDSTMFRMRPQPPVLAELWDRYREFHLLRGNDLQVWLRLPDLLEAAGLDVLIDTVNTVVVDLAPGMRSPAWAAREAMVAAGVADGEDLARWAAELEKLDAEPRRPRGYFPCFIAAARRRAT